MSGVREHCEWDEVQGLLDDGDAPTPDDVSVALDGRRLDFAEAVERFFEELRLEREGGVAAAEDDEGPPLDVRRVVEALDRHHVEYMLVGGSAARLYGSEHLAKDVDLVPDSAVENLDRLAAALRDLEAFMRVGGLSDAEARSLPVVIDAMALGRIGDLDLANIGGGP